MVSSGERPTRVASRATAPTAPSRLEPAWGALPLPISSFIGREAQLSEVERLLGDGRLVTLTGAGGCGKTRLALELGRRQTGAFPYGVTFVPLAPLGDPSFVAPAVGRALGIAEGPGRPYHEAVALALRDRKLLLILDNFEHVLDAAPLVGGWLLRCPDLKIVVTSREWLRLQGERVYQVPPLSVAAPVPSPAVAEAGRCAPVLPKSGGDGVAVAAESALTSEAVCLFVERARQVEPDFALSDTNAAAIVEICRQLDGLPLAIELAAAQVRILPPQAMLPRIDLALSLPTAAPRDVPARQRTLRDTLAWSHALLSDAEQRMFRRLSVFAGGWTLEAVEAVCDGAATGEPEGPHDAGLQPSFSSPHATLDVVAALIDKSLVRADHLSHERRFGMLQTIRSYAHEQLVASGEAPALFARHASYHLALAEEAMPHLTGPDQALWMARLQAAHPDFRMALRWLIEQRDGETAARLLWALGVFLWARSHIAEAGRWAEEILGIESLAPLAEAQTRGVAGMAAFKQGRYPAAVTHLTRSRELFRASSEGRGAALAALLLGHVLPKVGQIQEAPVLLREAQAGFESLGDGWGAGLALAGLAIMALMAGDRDTASARFEQHLALARAAGDRRSIGQALDGLALVALWGDDHARAASLLAESLPICVEVGHTEFAAYGLGGVARVFSTSQPERAARLLGCAQRLLSEAGIDEWPVRRDLFEAAQARARDRLGDDAFAAAFDVGRRMSAGDAANDALAALPTAAPVQGAPASDDAVATPTPAPPATPGPERRQRFPGGLSRREAEVARLVAAGKTSREIAQELVVSERTVTTHLDHIFAKLGVSSRTAVAMFALRNGLA